MKAIHAIVIGSLAIASCKTVYVPNMVNMPLLREQGEFHGSLGIASDLQLAYAATEHLGLMANGFYKSETNTLSDSSEQNGHGSLVEFGAGYFNAFHDLFSGEVFGGIGFGSVTSENVDAGGTTRTFKASGLKMFIQPGLGLSSRFLDVGVAGRFAIVKFANIQTTNYSDSLLMADGLFGLDVPTYMFFEPAFTIRAGYQWAKLFGQLGTSLKLNSEALNFRSTYALIGLHITLAPRYMMVE